MAITSLSNLSLRTIANEFGGSTPHSISEYYRNNGLIPPININNRIPNSGSQIRFSNFNGTSRTYFTQELYRGGPGNYTFNLDSNNFVSFFIMASFHSFSATYDFINPPVASSPFFVLNWRGLKSTPNVGSGNVQRSNVAYTSTSISSSVTFTLSNTAQRYLIMALYNQSQSFFSNSWYGPKGSDAGITRIPTNTNPTVSVSTPSDRIRAVGIASSGYSRLSSMTNVDYNYHGSDFSLGFDVNAPAVSASYTINGSSVQNVTLISTSV
jgi:hypothetical protein